VVHDGWILFGGSSSTEKTHARSLALVLLVALVVQVTVPLEAVLVATSVLVERPVVVLFRQRYIQYRRPVRAFGGSDQRTGQS
jgi:hypothetical protein